MSEGDVPEERRAHHVTMTDEQIEKLAKAAAKAAIEETTQRALAGFGRSILSMLLPMIGAICLGVYLFLSSKGIIK